MKRSFDTIVPKRPIFLDSDNNSDRRQKLKMDFSRNVKRERYFKEKLSTDHEIRFLIPHAHAGAIIGKGGAVITGLRTQYPQVAIRVPESTSPERVVDIWSQSSTEALRMFREVIDTLQADLGGIGDGMEVRLLYNEDYFVEVSKTNGDGWMQGLAYSNRIEYKNYSLRAPHSTERILYLHGLPSDIVTVVNSILTFISEVKVELHTTIYIPYDANNWDEALCRAYGGYHNGETGSQKYSRPSSSSSCLRSAPPKIPPPPPPAIRLRPPQPHRMSPLVTPFAPPHQADLMPFQENDTEGYPLFQPKIVSVQYTVPELYAGALIGRRGDTIEWIRRVTGAQITIRDNWPKTFEKLITIRGTQVQVDDATLELQTRALEEDQALENRNRNP